jgi:hypothetical protein
MSYQLLQQMDDWEEDTDSLLIQLPIVGCAFRKSYFDPVKGYNCSTPGEAQDFVVNYWTKDLATCPRATHVLTFYPHEVAEKMRAGTWLKGISAARSQRQQRRPGAAHVPRAAPAVGPGRRRLSRALHRHRPQGDGEGRPRGGPLR